MKKYIATENERLDSIIYKEYKTLDKTIFNEVLSANKHLLKKLVLNAFDTVYLPDIELQHKKEDKTLW